MKSRSKKKDLDRRGKKKPPMAGSYIDYHNYDAQFDGDQAPVQGMGDPAATGDAGGGDGGGMGESEVNIAEGNSKSGMRKLKQLAAAARAGDERAMSKLRALSAAINTGVDYKHLVAARGVANRLPEPAKTT